MTQLSGGSRYLADFAADASVEQRRSFIRKTYLHLVGAVLAFVGIEAALLSTEFAGEMAQRMTSGMSWLIVLGLFMVVSYAAERMARSAVSMPMQYLGLGLYVAAEAVIFVPLVYMASKFGGPNVIPAAGALTAVLFVGLTLSIFFTGSDFSFLRSALYFMGFVAMGVIVCSILFGFTLGIIFTVLMLVFACLWILFQTSQVMHHYQVGQHVSASLALFASVALLFWYAIRLMSYLQADD